MSQHIINVRHRGFPRDLWRTTSFKTGLDLFPTEALLRRRADYVRLCNSGDLGPEYCRSIIAEADQVIELRIGRGLIGVTQ